MRVRLQLCCLFLCCVAHFWCFCVVLRILMSNTTQKHQKMRNTTQKTATALHHWSNAVPYSLTFFNCSLLFYLDRSNRRSIEKGVRVSYQRRDFWCWFDKKSRRWWFRHFVFVVAVRVAVCNNNNNGNDENNGKNNNNDLGDGDNDDIFFVVVVVTVVANSIDFESMLLPTLTPLSIDRICLLSRRT